MRKAFRICSAFLLVLATSSLLHGDSEQKDPLERFTLTVPSGWRVVASKDEMKLTMGDSTIIVRHLDGLNNAQKALVATLQMSTENYFGFMKMEDGPAILGGEHALAANFSAYDEHYTSVYIRCVATDSGWTFYAVSPQNGFSALRETLIRVEQSFQLTKKP